MDPWSDALPAPTFYPRIVYSDDGFAYASGPTGTGVFPIALDALIDWAAWSPFAPAAKAPVADGRLTWVAGSRPASALDDCSRRILRGAGGGSAC